MKYKVGDKVIFNQDCRLAFSCIPKGKTGEITDIVDTGLAIHYRIKMQDYPNATVPTDKADEACTKINPTNEKHNILNGMTQTDTLKPDYYKYRGGDVFDMAKHFELDYPLGSALKYLLRAGHKDPAKKVEDLQKCIECIKRHIELVV